VENGAAKSSFLSLLVSAFLSFAQKGGGYSPTLIRYPACSLNKKNEREMQKHLKNSLLLPSQAVTGTGAWYENEICLCTNKSYKREKWQAST
jgi:hypothetical protein